MPIDPIIGGAAIGAGASLLGGMLGRRSARRQDELQREFAQHGIRWKVEDARAAGLHPLFALGGAGATFSPSATVDPMAQGLAQAGQEVGRAVAATETAEQRVIRRWQLELLKSQVGVTQAQEAAIYSQIGRDAQAAQVSKPMPSAVQMNPDFMFSPQNPDVRRSGVNEVKVNPSQTTSFAAGERSMEAGVVPMWQTFTYRDQGGKTYRIVLPGKEAAERLESLSESLGMSIGVVIENLRRNPQFFSELFGVPPERRSRDPRTGGPIIEGPIRR